MRLGLFILIWAWGTIGKAQTFSDFQTWWSASAGYKINKEWSIDLSHAYRTKENATQLQSTFTDAKFSRRLNKRFSLGLNYRYAHKSDNENGIRHGHRYGVQLSYSKKIKPITFGLRSRYQKGYWDLYDVENQFDPKIIWRNKLTLDFDFDKDFEPFIGTEIFSNLNDFGINGMRYFIGSSIKINKRSSLELKYILENSDDYKGLKTTHALVVAYDYKFKKKKKKKGVKPKEQ